MFHYREAASSEIPAATRAVAERGRDVICRLLNLPRVEVRWLVPCDARAADLIRRRYPRLGVFAVERAAYGLYEAGRPWVWVRADLSLRETAMTVAHELRHADQHRRGAFVSRSTASDQDARAFEADFDRMLAAAAAKG